GTAGNGTISTVYGNVILNGGGLNENNNAAIFANGGAGNGGNVTVIVGTGVTTYDEHNNPSSGLLARSISLGSATGSGGNFIYVHQYGDALGSGLTVDTSAPRGLAGSVTVAAAGNLSSLR